MGTKLEQARAEIAHRRQRWRSWQAGPDPQCLVLIDETWIKINMAPLRGWGPEGQRLRGFAPHGHWRSTARQGGPRSWNCRRFADQFRRIVRASIDPTAAATTHRGVALTPSLPSQFRSNRRNWDRYGPAM